MLALYRSGRQADALEAFQRMRVLFASELGLEPGEPLVATARADPRGTAGRRTAPLTARGAGRDGGSGPTARDRRRACPGR